MRVGQTDMVPVPDIDGADTIVAWFGAWPAFHDHYVLTVPTSATAAGELRIHGWVTNWKATDASGRFLQDRHCVVTFDLSEIVAVELAAVDPAEHVLPAIIGDLTLAKGPLGWTITWDSSYGSAGTIRAGSVRVRLQPGAPSAKE